MPRNRITTELRADSAQLRGEFAKAQKRVGEFRKGVKSAGTDLAQLAVGALGVRQGIRVFSDFVSSASDLNETLSKTSAIFGKDNTISEWAAKQEEALGLSTQAALDFATRFGGALREIGGRSREESQEISQDLVALSADLASFFNSDQGQARDAIAGALTGEFEQLKKFNVIINETILKERALTLGVSSGKGPLDARTKQLVALDLIYQKTGDAQGDFAKTSQGVANQQRILAARLENTKAKLGQDLLPVQLEFIKIASAGVDVLGEFVPALNLTAEAVASLSGFLVKHRKAVTFVLGSYVAYKAALKGISYAKFLVDIGRSILALTTSKVAIDKETAALAKNTAAQALNSKSRKSGAAGNLATSIGSGVGVVGKGAAILKKIFPPVAVAAIGYGTGRLFGDKFADAIDSGRLKAFDQINDPIDEILATTFDQIQASRTVADTEAAREKIAKNISSLQRNQLQSANEQERIAAEHAIAILKTRDRSADIVRERQKQLDIEKGISTELGDQSVALENQRFRAETAAAGREARAANEKKRTSEIREEINSLASEIRGKKFDLLPDSEKIKIFEKELADAFSRVAATGDLSRRLRGAESLPATSFDSEEDLQARIKEAQKDGNDAEVLNLAKELQKVQELNIKINALKKEQLERTKAETVEQERLAQVEQSKADSQAAARAKFAQDLALTKLRANGREEEAKALEKEIALRQEAQRLAVETGVTEEKALALLRQKAALEARGNAKPGGGFGDGRDIGLDSRFDKDGNRRLSSNGKRKKIVVIKRNKDGVRIDSRALAARKAAQKVKPEIPVGKIDRLIQLTEDANSLWGTLQSSS